MPKKVTKNQVIQALGSAVMLVIRGCQNGAIKCRSSIVSINPDAEQLEPISLEERMCEALVAAGLYEALVAAGLYEKKEGEKK